MKLLAIRNFVSPIFTGQFKDNSSMSSERIHVTSPETRHGFHPESLEGFAELEMEDPQNNNDPVKLLL